MVPDWLEIKQAQLRVSQSRQIKVYLSRFRPRTSTVRGWPIAGLLSCDCFLVFVCACLWQKKDQMHLFLAESLLKQVALGEGYSRYHF